MAPKALSAPIERIYKATKLPIPNGSAQHVNQKRNSATSAVNYDLTDFRARCTPVWRVLFLGADSHLAARSAAIFRTNKVRSRDRLYGAQGMAFLRMAVARRIAANVAKLPELWRK
jgi:hypothetical protein